MAWLQLDIDQSRELIPPPAPCSNAAGATCDYCQAGKILTSQAQTLLVVGRVDPSTNAPIPLRRINIAEGPPASWLQMVAHGDTLAVSISMPDSIRYLELDPTNLF